MKAPEWDKNPTDISWFLRNHIEIPMIIWGGNYFHFPLSRCWLAWIKRDSVATMSSVELAWTNFDKPAKYFDTTIAATNSERNGHPTLKPLKLMKWCINQQDNWNIGQTCSLDHVPIILLINTRLHYF